MISARHIALFALFFVPMISAQVMNDAKILSQENVNIGIAPVSANSSFGLYADLDYGITRGMDLDVIQYIISCCG